jgi:outer membrane protein OmpA-like peptidoglycan-associated protein
MKNKLLLSTAYVALICGAGLIPAHAAQAQEVTPSQVAGATVYYPDYDDTYVPGHFGVWGVWLDYYYREPCQHYQAPPAGYFEKGCAVYRINAPVEVTQTTTQTTQTTQATTPVAVPVPENEGHTIYFDYNKSDIRPSEQAKIDRVAQEIRAGHHEHVTVAGHTDTVGSAAYNMTLSQKRVHVITTALIADGISKDVLNEVLDDKAYGKTDLAVQTGNNVKNQANRRTVISFTQ